MSTTSTYCLFEDTSTWDLQPLTLTRPVFALRCGILTNHDRWSHLLKQQVSTCAHGHLHPVFSRQIPHDAAIWINGKLFPDQPLLDLIQDLPPNHFAINDAGTLLAFSSAGQVPETEFAAPFTAETLGELGLQEMKVSLTPQGIYQLEDLFLSNRQQLLFDFDLLTQVEVQGSISDQHSIIYGKDNLFVGEGVSVKAAIINAEDGPIFLGRNATVMEGAVIRNAHALCEHATVNVGAKLRGDTTIGPWSKVGGEIGNSIIMGFSNKGHDGYLGNSVLGYWCNIGADTNTSNLKNNYAPIKIWHYPSGRFRDTGRQFCGLIMGDHSKAGINTMFNTGTVVGVSANIFGGGFPRTFIPSFTWGGAAGFSTYRFSKAMETAEKVMIRRKKDLTGPDRALLQAVFDKTQANRYWEKVPRT